MMTNQNEKGFSLIELLMVIALSSGIFYVLARGLSIGTDQMNEASIRMNIQESAREGLYKMVQEIRQSSPSRITIGAGGNTLFFTVPNPNSPVAADYTINWAGGRVITYAMGAAGATATQIIRTDSSTPGQTRVVANDVTGLQFVGNIAAPTLVTITVSVQKELVGRGSMYNGTYVRKLVPNPPLQISAQAEVRNV